MAHVMTKRGQQDNIVTYEHICDATEDMANIDPRYITLGSICIVLGDGGIEAYMANSKKQWISVLGSSDDEEEEAENDG